MTSVVVTLTGPSPWGFRISGGRDFRRVLTISKVHGSSKADQANLRVGDVIVEINGQSTAGMLHVQAQNNIKSSRPQLRLLIDRPRSAIFEQTRCIGPPQEPASQKQITVSRGLEAYRGGNEKILRTENDRRYQYSDTAPTQKVQPTMKSAVKKTEGCVPNNTKSVSFDVPRQKYPLLDSEVYQSIQGRRETPTNPRQSNTFRLLQEVLEADPRKSTLRIPEKPSTGSPGNPSLYRVLQKFHTCESCGTPIVTQAVRIREGHYRHHECYICKDCGLTLLKRGHFWVGEDLFCGKHARQRYQRTK